MYQGHWATRFFKFEPISRRDGRMRTVRWVCSKIKSKKKFLVPNFTPARIGVVVRTYYVTLNNVYVKNDKLYASTWQDPIVDLVEKAKKAKKKKKCVIHYNLASAQIKMSNDKFWRLQGIFLVSKIVHKNIGLTLQVGQWLKQCTTLYFKPLEL